MRVAGRFFPTFIFTWGLTYRGGVWECAELFVWIRGYGGEGGTHLAAWGVGVGARPPLKLAIPVPHQLYIYYCDVAGFTEINMKPFMYTTTVVLNDMKTTTHKSWTKSDALAWLWLNSKKDAVAKQQFAKVTDLFGRRIAVRYYR